MLSVVLALVAGAAIVAGILALRARVPAWRWLAGGLSAGGLILVTGLAGVELQARFDVKAAIRARLVPSQQPEAAPVKPGDPALRYRISRGDTPLSAPTGEDPAALRAWQVRFRTILREDLFRIPPRDPRRAVVANPAGGPTELPGAVRVERGHLRVHDGASIPVAVVRPAGAGPHPGVVLVPGHVRDGESGIDQLLTGDLSYQHAGARHLAAAGYVVAVPELRGFGALGPPDFPDHRLVAYNAMLAGSSYKALILSDISVLVDYLAELEDVAPQRLGIAGASLGGELAVAYAAIDERIRAVAFHSYAGGTGQFLPATVGDRQPHYCHIIPGSGTLFRREDILLLLAPRPTQGVRGTTEPFGDPRFPAQLGRAWRAFGTEPALELGSAPGGHELFVEPLIDFFDRHLRRSTPRSED